MVEILASRKLHNNLLERTNKVLALRLGVVCRRSTGTLDAIDMTKYSVKVIDGSVSVEEPKSSPDPDF